MWKGERQRHSMAKRQISSVMPKRKFDSIHKPFRNNLGSEELKDMIKKEFEPGGAGYKKPYYDDDWFRFYPDGSWENHECCPGCKSDGSCDFHPEDDWYEWEEEQDYIEYPSVESIPFNIQEQLLEEYEKGIQSGMDKNKAIEYATNVVTEELEENGAELTHKSFLNMEKMLAQESLLAYGKKIRK